MVNDKPRTCKKCGTIFTPPHARSQYCSEACRLEAKREAVRKWQRNNRQKQREASKKWRERRSEYNKERLREWRKRNKEHCAQYARSWREENADHYKEIRAQWYERNAQHVREYVANYKATHPERIKEYQRNWMAKNPHKVGEIKARRAQAELEGNATPELVRAKWEASDHTCILCGEPIDNTLSPRHPMSRTLEHLTPIARGGRHDIDNIAFAHYSCNSQKRDKTLEEYRAWQARLQQAT